MAADEAARRFAQSEFEHPVVVVAGAGTGKTALLVSRVVVWCVGPGWDRHATAELDDCAIARRVIERVVAITFTEAAAAEMARKIGVAFLELAGAKPVGWDPEPGLVPDGRGSGTARPGVVGRGPPTGGVDHPRVLPEAPLHLPARGRSASPVRGRCRRRRIQELAENVVEEALRGLGDSQQSHDWELLAAEGVSPAALVDALCKLVDAGADPEVLAADPYDDAAAAAVARRVRDRGTGSHGRRRRSARRRQGRGDQATGTVGGQVAEIDGDRGLCGIHDRAWQLPPPVDPRAIDTTAQVVETRFNRAVRTSGVGGLVSGGGGGR